MIEFQTAPVRSSVRIPAATLWADYQGGDVNKGFAELEKQAETMIEEELWTTALKSARKGQSSRKLTARYLGIEILLCRRVNGEWNLRLPPELVATNALCFLIHPSNVPRLTVLGF